MADPRRLSEFATRQGWRYQYRTWREGMHWHAEVKAWKGGKVVGWFGTDGQDTEQNVLDRAIDLLIAGNRKRVCGPINLGNPLAERERQ